MDEDRLSLHGMWFLIVLIRPLLLPDPLPGRDELTSSVDEDLESDLDRLRKASSIPPGDLLPAARQAGTVSSGESGHSDCITRLTGRTGR